MFYKTQAFIVKKSIKKRCPYGIMLFFGRYRRDNFLLFVYAYLIAGSSYGFGTDKPSHLHIRTDTKSMYSNKITDIVIRYGVILRNNVSCNF